MKKNRVRAGGSQRQQPQRIFILAIGSEHRRGAVPQRRRLRCGSAFFALALLVACGLAQANVGRTPGTFAVDQDGEATYTIPIFAPPGPNGLEPHISLVYGSQGTDYVGRDNVGIILPNGLLSSKPTASFGSSDGVDVSVGVGWSIAGLSVIYRCNKTVAQDGAAASVDLVAGDGYCLDGQRLRLTSGTYGTAGSVYQTEIANFSQVTAEGTAGNGPAYFEVQGKDGRTYEYGYNGKSQVSAGGGSTAWQWWLDKVTDRAGNTMIISYSTTDVGSEVVPETISWTPSSYGSTTQYNYSMEFTYTADPNNVTSGYAAGFEYSNGNLLQSIAINYNGSLIKDYFLGHQVSSATSRELLTQIEECADSAQSNCLAPTTFSYQGSQIGVSATATAAASGVSSNLVAHYDFNADGRDDLAYCNGGSPNVIEVAFASASGYGTPVNTGIACGALFGDLLGNGKDGILANNGGTWYYYTWNGSSFTGVSTGLARDSSATQYLLADVNGDGLPDLVESKLCSGCSLYVYVRLNTSSSSSPSFSGTNAQWYSAPYYTYFNGTPTYLKGALLQSNTDAQYGDLKKLDFNGDGMADLAIELEEQQQGTYGTTNFTQIYELISTGSGFGSTVIATEAATGYYPVGFLNFNFDKCTDYLMPAAYDNNLTPILYLSGCNGANATTLTLPQGTNVLGVTDWDGDGRDDILVSDGSTIGVYLSDGTTVSGLIQTSVPYNAPSSYFTFNSTGGGEDLGVWNGSTVSLYEANSTGHPPDLLTDITDGYGNSIQPTYLSLAQGSGSTYTAPSSAPSNYAPYTDMMYVVSKETYSDPSNPPNGTYTLTHSYSGALESINGRGFAGFAGHTVLDSRSSLSEAQGFGQVFPYTGMITSDVVTDSAHSATVSSTSDTPNTLASAELSSTPNEEIWFPYVSNSTRKDYQVYEVGGSENGDLIATTTSSFNFNNYGNLVSSSQTVKDNDPGSLYSGSTWTTSVSNTTDENPATWCLTLLTETQVTYTDTYDNTSIPLTREFTPDPDFSNCRYTQIVAAPGSNYQLTENLGYDSFGNIISDTVTGTGMSPRVSTASWGATGQLPVTVQDPVGYADGYEEQIGYDYRFGLKASDVVQTTGGTQNAPPAQWAYDAFGRLEMETRPDGTTTQWSYTSCTANGYCPGSSKIEIHGTMYDTAGHYMFDVQSYPDAADRIIQKFARTLNASGSYYSFESWQYDALGRLVGHLMPCLTAVCNTSDAVTYSYDGRNEVTSAQRPTSDENSSPATTKYMYAGDTTTITDANNNVRTLTRDPNGWLRKTEDATGYAITLSYDAAGSHTGTTDSAGNPLWSGTVQYGIAPFTTVATDADLGTWHYTFDALGELTAWSDAKGQSFSAHYDELSRMTDRYERDLYSHWTWGTSAAAHEIGQLHSVCTGTGVNPTACTSASGYAESETYDVDGRLNQRSIVIPGDSSYAYNWSYDATTGLLDTLTYPADSSGYRLQVGFGYVDGALQSITDLTDSPHVALWTGNSVDGRNGYTQETLGNGVVVNHDFDTVTGLVGSVTAGPSGNATLQNNSYLYDGIGNLIQRQDNNAGTTENVYYDSLNRLAHTVGDTSTQMTYDTLGRIATWEASAASANVDDYTTQQAGCTYYANAQPHAVRGERQGSWPPASYCYDANGNFTTQISSGTVLQSFTWTSFNQPNKLTAPTLNSYSQFYYDQNHQRYEQIASYSGSIESTEYIGGLLEKMSNSSGTSYRYYVPAGNNFVVYNRWVGGTPVIDYVTKDNLGSTSVITDKNGVLVVSEKYAALGWNENTAAQQSTMASITRHRFAGAEELDNSGIWAVNMNGRVYQPSGARFYSPDPDIQDPSNTQSYDRYNYVFNNPLSYIDPSGFDCQPITETSDAPPGYQIVNVAGSSIAWACSNGDMPPPPPLPQVTITPGPPVNAGVVFVPAPSPLPTLSPDQFPAMGLSAAANVGVQQNGPCNAPPLSTASNRPYDPADPATHNYSVSTSVLGLTGAQAAQLLDLWRNGPNAAPGIAPNTPDFTPTLLANIPLTPNTNWIYIQPINNGWVNVTLPGHYFYSGTVTNSMSFTSWVTTLTSTGTGNTSRWFQNDAFGEAFFKASQLEAIGALMGLPRVRIGAAGSCNNPSP